MRSLFLLSRVGEDADILAAAARAGVEHVVLVSSITVETHPHLPAAKENLEVERLLLDSGMAWTILRPTQFASNTVWWAEEISRAAAYRDLASYLGDETASAVLDLMGGDVNDALLDVRDTVPRVTGLPARSFRQWATENVAAFR